jgi:hypothetical protein
MDYFIKKNLKMIFGINAATQKANELKKQSDEILADTQRIIKDVNEIDQQRQRMKRPRITVERIGDSIIRNVVDEKKEG